MKFAAVYVTAVWLFGTLEKSVAGPPYYNTSSLQQDSNESLYNSTVEIVPFKNFTSIKMEKKPYGFYATKKNQNGDFDRVNINKDCHSENTKFICNLNNSAEYDVFCLYHQLDLSKCYDLKKYNPSGKEVNNSTNSTIVLIVLAVLAWIMIFYGAWRRCVHARVVDEVVDEVVDVEAPPPSYEELFAPPPAFDDVIRLDPLNYSCRYTPARRTTPTLTPTTLRTIAADIPNLSPAPSESFATAASDLHHLVSSSCSTMSTSTSGAFDRTNLQELVNINNPSNRTMSLQSINNQQISLNNLQDHQNVNQNTLNQQQHNDYNNSFSTAASRQAGFVPPLVLQINSTNPIAQKSSGTTILLNNNTSSGASSIYFSAKGSSTSASSSHWQGVVVTKRPQKRARSITRKQFTDDEDGDDEYDSAADDGTDSSDTTSSEKTRKQNTKNNKSSSKNGNKNEFKNSSGGGRRTNNKDNKMMSAEEELRRRVRRERNKLEAARCRKRRMDHTINELLEETGQLEDKRLRLQVEIQGLRQQKTDLQQMLAQHKCAVNMNNVQLSISVATVSHATTILDSNEITETKPIILSNHLSSIKGSSLQQNISKNVVINDNDSKSIIIKHEDNLKTDIDTKDSINIILTSVMQQPHRRRPTTLCNSKKISGNGSTGVVVLNFDSLVDGGTGLTPVSSSGGNHHQQVQHNSTGNGGVNTENNSILS